MKVKIDLVGWLVDDDDLLMRVGVVVALLLLLLLFFYGPGYQAASRKPKATEVIPLTPVPQPPVVRARPKRTPKAVFLASGPATPQVQNTPAPAATPPGGGTIRKIAFVSNRADGRHYQIYMMDSNGGSLERLTESDGFDRDPHFSNAGWQLAFSSNRTGVYQIYILDMLSRTVQQVTQGGEDKTNPFWSPNDKQILFTLNKNGLCEMGIIDLRTLATRKLAKSRGNSYGYGFAPDGRWVSFVSTMNDRNEIFAMDVKTEEIHLLVQTDELTFQGNPVFSPVGNKMVFSSNAQDRNVRQLYVYDLDWKKYYRLTEDPLDKAYPIFSPDGTKILYSALWHDAWNIFIMDANGKNQRNLTQTTSDNIVPTWR